VSEKSGEHLGVENKNKIDHILPKGSFRRGVAYIGIFLTGLYFVGDNILQERISEVNGQIDQTGDEVSAEVEKNISPATKTIDSFMKDYNQFRVDICLTPLGEQMEGCADLLEDYYKDKAKEEALEIEDENIKTPN
jgi:hypothetical protein